MSDTGTALAGMFDLTAQRLVRLAMTITGNQQDAEDAVQGAFSRIARRMCGEDVPLDQFLRGGSFWGRLGRRLGVA